MSIGNEIAYRRSQRGKDATGSLVFDAERQRALNDNSDRPKRKTRRIVETFPG